MCMVNTSYIHNKNMENNLDLIIILLYDQTDLIGAEWDGL